MRRPSAIPKHHWDAVAKLYQSGLSMQKVADTYKVHIDAVSYILRKSKVPRRSFTEANKIAFESKQPSFSIRPVQTKEMNVIGAMLYWAEGYKTQKAPGIDFANSDPDMAYLFLRFLTTRYTLDRDRLYCQIYYYADQDISSLTTFWSRRLNLPLQAFRYPYKKQNPQLQAKKLQYGVVHIRYNDKKLLWDVLNLINSYRLKLCVGGRAVNCT